MRLNYKRAASLLVLLLVWLLSLANCSQGRAANLSEADADEKELNRPSFSKEKNVSAPTSFESHTEGAPKPFSAGKAWGHFGPGPLDLTPLDLTAEQKQKIQEMRKQMGTKARDMHKMLREKRKEMRDLMFSPDVTESQLREKHRQLRKLQEQAENMMFQDFLSIRVLLSPEQKKHLPEVKPQGKDLPPPQELGREPFNGLSNGLGVDKGGPGESGQKTKGAVAKPFLFNHNDRR